MTTAFDPLDADEIRRVAAYEELSVILLGEVDSTNSEARRLLSCNPLDGTVVIANSQTAGRGRRGHSFYSPEDTGLYFSYILRSFQSVHLEKVTVAAAVAAAEAIEECSSVRPQIKWVNDLFVDEKKVGGILCETVAAGDYNSIDAVIIGIGINCHTTDFPDEIKGKAGFIGENAPSRNVLAGLLWQRMAYWTLRLDYSELMDRYRRRSMLLSRTVRYERAGKNLEGIATAINDDGNLVVRLLDGTTDVLRGGEVSLGSWN